MSSEVPGNKIVPELTIIELFILLAIKKGPLHGLGIFEAVAKRTNNELIIVPGTLYSALKRMYRQNWIELSEEGAPGKVLDERRKFYRLTDLGKQILEVEKERLRNVTNVIEEDLSEDGVVKDESEKQSDAVSKNKSENNPKNHEKKQQAGALKGSTKYTGKKRGRGGSKDNRRDILRGQLRYGSGNRGRV